MTGRGRLALRGAAPANEPAGQHRVLADSPAAGEGQSSSSVQGGQFTQMRQRAEAAEDMVMLINGYQWCHHLHH